MNAKFTLVSFLVNLIHSETSLPAKISSLLVDTESHQLVDQDGRIRIFHGVNFVAKHPPWYHAALLDDEYARDLANWGLNVVRLGAMWSGFEPQEGYFDLEYVQKLKTIVRNFEKYGVNVILDMHQDVASRHFGTYDGFPDWLVDKLRSGTERKFPWPLASVDNWFCGYITYEACDVYQNFYDNKYGAIDKLARVWKLIASEFKDENNVIGYNIINEPWAGNVFKDGSLLLPGETGRKNLAPMYDEVNKAVREVDQNTILFWEAATWSHWGFNSRFSPVNEMVVKFFKKNPALTWLGGISRACGKLDLSITDSDADFCMDLKNQSRHGQARQLLPRADLADCFEQSTEEALQSKPDIGDSAFGTGFQTVPGGSDFQNRSVMSWHYYFPLLVYETQEYPWWQRQIAHKMFGPTVFNGAKKEVEKLGGGKFLTEFGICVPDSSRPDYWGTVECKYVLKKADEQSLSWCYWDTSNLGVLWNSIGTPIQTAVDVLSRPYPIAVSGKNLKYSFDPESKVFDIEFYDNPDIILPTLVFVPKHTYGTDLEVIVSDDLSYKMSKENMQVIEINIKDNRESERQEKSWVVLGISGQVSTVRTSSTWMETFWSFIPFFGR
eukprot:TRINITY_DN9987_c0_g1_i4.p1 TRINITY_DN9987_c0_g1~~TRINITY_DN9987_c0_g1_i4.p1  ORF type:complete len:610 (-),score=147.15 TRINITY_DN9987_c0_g1_i4:118-1947(-)